MWTENLPSENDVIKMIKRIAYISILLVWGCNSLIEKSAPLGGDFYIQDGWLAFSSSKYEEADKHFNTAIETNDSGSVFHFLSLVGLGWSNIYKARIIEGTSSNGYVNDAGERLNAAHESYKNASIKLVDGKGSMVRQAEMLQDLGVKTDKTIPREFKKSLKDQT